MVEREDSENSAATAEEVTFELHGRIESYDGLYVSFCDEFPLIGTGASQADSISSLFICFKEFVQLSQEWGIADQTVGDWDSYAAAPPGSFALSLSSSLNSQEVAV